MFKSATVRLTLSYLAILTLISLFFSVIVYSVSSRELDRGFRGRGSISEQFPGISGFEDDIRQIIENRVAEGHHRLILNLVYTNALILLLGGLASYWLSRYTLKPIEEAHEAQSRFTADASHELRTPIAAMRSEIEVALEDPRFDKKQARELLLSNVEELDKLTALSDSLLRLARLDSDEMAKKPVSVQDIIGESLQRVLPSAEKKNMLIEQDVQKNLKIVGDQASLIELLVILLDNAVKYSPPKTRVKVSAKKQQKHVLLQVVDQGQGMRATEIPHIFERFYRADSSRTKEHPNGYGLGLAIAQSIAELHGTAISVKSAPKKGSTFGIKLPVEA